MSSIADVENRPASFLVDPKRISHHRSSLHLPFPRCTQCRNGHKGNSRNLIVCIDGTSNQFGQNNTNVVKLFAKINLETGSDQPEQFAYYSSGIGTRPKSLNIFDRMERAVSDKFDMAVAWGMEEIVKDAYGWLARTYQEGDQIYLFGFSRGAYQVRVLAGMIYEVGLIRTYTDKQIGTAYDHYKAIRPGKPKARQIAQEFKKTFSWPGLGVHFVGVWDTVSSVGLIRGDVFLSTSSSASHACHFRHALALDELRVKFMPEYFHEMNSRTDGGRSKYVITSDVESAAPPTSERPEASTSDSGTDVSKGKGKAAEIKSDVEHATSPTSERREASTSDKGTDTSGGKKKTTEIKEVWFAGCHSDVGGTNRPGKSHQAGNVSLLWMRREAAASGLVLHPTDIVWVPDDLDFGTSSSMSLAWEAVEWLPIKHQVSFSGSDDDVRRWHRKQPRRIIPGQKVHASIVYANSYKPRASRGEGFDILTAHGELEPKLNDELWETGLFDDTAAEQLVAHLGVEQGVAPVYLDRLLFMLRFEEGRQCVRKVEDWQDKFKNLINKPGCPELVRLVTIVAYYEASCNLDAAKSPAQPHDGLPPDTRDNLVEILRRPMHQDGPSDPDATNGTAQSHGNLPVATLEKARKGLFGILEKPMHRDGPRVVALLRPLTKHKDLLDHVLDEGVLEKLVGVLDTIIKKKEGNFGQAMDGLIWLLQCERTRGFIIPKLKEKSRLERILDVKKPDFLIAALRMVLFLARISEVKDKESTAVHECQQRDAAAAKEVCSSVKHRLRELAAKKERQVGILAVEILLVLYDESEESQLNISKGSVRANVAGALVRLNKSTKGSTEQGSDGGNAGILNHLFGFGVRELAELTNKQRQLIRKLKVAIQEGNSRERTAATLTVLKLCETEAIRTFLRQIDLLDVFINQLRRKDSALLAAYALTVCLQYGEMKALIKDSDVFSKNIVRMVKLDYFDDAVGSVEGFQIFGELMSDDDLRKKIIKDDTVTDIPDTKPTKVKDNTITDAPNTTLAKVKGNIITDVLDTKLSKGKPKETRTGLICLDIFRSLKQNGPWTKDLVTNSLFYLSQTEWKVQKAGVTILSALAQTEHGVAAILPRIPEIVEMLLPENRRLIRPTPMEHQDSPSEAQTGQSTTPDSDIQVTSAQAPALETPAQETPAQETPAQETPAQETLEQDAPPVPPSWMMGPACALRILAQNEILRKVVRDTREYDGLKDMFLSNMLVGQVDTSAWRIRTPNRNDVLNELDKMIKAVDEELSEENLMSIGSTVLPHIKHWDRLVDMIRNRAVAAITILPVVLGVSTLAILAVIVVTPIYLSVEVIGFLKKLAAYYRDSPLMEKLRGVHNPDGDEGDQNEDNGGDINVRAGEGAPPRDGGEDPSGAIGGEHAHGGAVFEAPANAEGTAGETSAASLG